MSYSSYLGAKRCCDNRGSGPQGSQGPEGKAGPIGPVGFTGATGATGGSPWILTNFKGVTGPGYTGTGYTGDVMIFGSLYVNGGNINLQATASTGIGNIIITPNSCGVLILNNLPINSTGLPIGAVWNNNGVLSIV